VGSVQGTRPDPARRQPANAAGATCRGRCAARLWPRRGSTGTRRTPRPRRSSDDHARTARAPVMTVASTVLTRTVSRAVRSHFPASCSATPILGRLSSPHRQSRSNRPRGPRRRRFVTAPTTAPSTRNSARKIRASGQRLRQLTTLPVRCAPNAPNDTVAPERVTSR